MLELKDIRKCYTSGGRPLEVLAGITARVKSGESLAIIGPSGSGKTTLLGISAGLDLPTSGNVLIGGTSLSGLNEDQRAALRSRMIGFVFQNFQLIPTLTALENVCIPMELKGQRNPRKQALQWLERVGLKDRSEHYPVQLSGGEQQRVAIARACAGGPSLLFADEPTGNLDTETSLQIEDLIFETHRQTGSTLVIVTHNPELAGRTDRVLRLRKGQIVDGNGDE